MLLAAVEPQGTALFLLVLGALIALSVLFSRQIDRLGVPIVLLFLVLGMLGGSEGIGRIAFDDFRFAVRVGTIYLVLILFDGGMNTPWRAVRLVLVPAGVLATVGVALTAGLLALFARALGLGWTEALLLGAVVSSTDAAAVLAVLRGGRLHLQARVGNALEVESCANDPMAMILTVLMIEIALSPEALRWTLVLRVPVQLGVGAAVGGVLGYLGQRVIGRIRPPTVGLYPALTLAFAFLSFGAATLLEGTELSGAMSTGRMIPWILTYSLPWLMAIHFWPRTSRLPLARRRATVTVMSPSRRLLWLLSPDPSKAVWLSTPILSTSVPLTVTGNPAMVGALMFAVYVLLVVVLELLLAFVFSTR